MAPDAPQDRRLNRNSPVDLYVQLADALKTRILAAEFTDRLPSQLDLAAEYGVHRDTVQAALRRLESQRWVISGGVRGYWVDPGHPAE